MVLPNVKQNANNCCQILLLTFKQARNNAIAGQDNVCNTVYDNKCETVYDTVQVQNRPPKPNFCKKNYFARILSCKPILQEEKCESKYDTKCETQYATEYEEVKKKHFFYIQCFPDPLLIPRFVVPRQGQSSRPSTTTSEL